MVKQQGFTLVELMIVIAIISILAVIIFPSYQDYIARAKVTSVINKLSEIKTKLSEYSAVEGKYPQDNVLSSIGIEAVGGTYYDSPSVKIVNEQSILFVLSLRNINKHVDLGSLKYKCSLQKKFTVQCACSVNQDLYSVVPAMCRHRQVV